jgi:polyhydroxyalkanoate synthesis regulator phasin
MELLEIVKRTMLTGVGLALVAKDEVEEIAKEIEKKLDMGEQDGKKLVKDLQNRWDEAQTKLEDRVETAVKDVMKKMDVVTSDELKALKKEIRELKKAVGKETGSQE